MGKLINLTNKENFITERGTILSTNLVTIINEFRKVESEANEEKKYTELKHDDLMKKIKREVETLERVGIISLGNISESTYVNTRGKTYPCYELNRDGMIIILNSESTIVRYYTIEYIKSLEEKLKEAEKTIKYYEKKNNFNDISPLLMETKIEDSFFNNFTNNAIRKEVERVIKEIGMPITQIARRINMSDSHISNWRNGNINFSEEKLNDILSVLDKAKYLL